MFAFNDSLFPALPWNGFTLGWFFGTERPMIGMFHDRRLLQGLMNSFFVGVVVSALSVAVGTCNAFLFERRDFRFKAALYLLLIVPLVIPGVILGISILVFASFIANGVEAATGIGLDFLRPGLFLVVLGQFSFLATITTLIIAARLRKFDVALEEAALNLGASRLRVLRDDHPAVPGAGDDRGVPRRLPRVVRELQHDADAGRVRRAADDHHVRPDGEGRGDAGAERGVGVPDARLGAAGAALDPRAAAAKGGLTPRRAIRLSSEA